LSARGRFEVVETGPGGFFGAVINEETGTAWFGIDDSPARLVKVRCTTAVLTGATARPDAQNGPDSQHATDLEMAVASCFGGPWIFNAARRNPSHVPPTLTPRSN